MRIIFTRRRRTRFVATVAIVAATATGLSTSTALTAATAEPGAATPTAAEVTVTEGTNLTASAAPDGSVVVDLQGLLYKVPAGGGDAEQLTDVKTEAALPDVGPDGRLAFQSYADGRFHIWTSGPAGSNPAPLTHGGFDDREPVWSPDGSRIAFSSDRGGSYDIWTVEVATGKLTQWTDDPGEEFQPSWSPDGTEIAHVAGNQVIATSAHGHARTLIAEPSDASTVHAPEFSPDGDRVAWIRHDGTNADLMVGDDQVTEGEDVFLFSPEWIADDEILYTADGGIHTRRLGTHRNASEIPFSATISLAGADYTKKPHDFDDRTAKKIQAPLTPQLAPDAESVAFIALNDLWLMPIGGIPEQLTDDNYHEVNPVFSADGRYLAYSSDRAGTEDIYIRDLSDDSERRVTALDSAEVSAAFSPDGKQLAFQDQAGATYVLNLADSTVRELVPSLFGPGRPSWSSDGETIAFSAVKRYSDRFREGTSQILTVDVDTGEQQFHAPGDKHASISTRGDDGPVWSPDGKSMAFVVNSTLRVVPVAANGTPTGPVREVNGEVADAPSWSGDSSELLYLSNGQLRIADAVTGHARDVDVPLRYRPDIATGRKVIHAGSFWDGKSRELRHDVDITVVGNRIQKISEHQDNRHTGEVIDASEQTVMPGLMDAHVHQAYESRFFGDRQGRISLAYGITSTLSVGDQVYRAMEDREALDAGERVGPRFYASGEPIDGSRVYYNFMRTTSSDEQVDLELTRAKELDYDFLKTYVRLPADRMKTVIDFAHELGVPSASHYLSPGSQLGQDGTTHLAATQRLGYARTISATGSSYDDVPALYGQGNRVATTTLFTTDFLNADEMAADPRLKLVPSWERESLMQRIANNTEPPSDPECETAECKEVQTFERIRKSGGQVLVGTDSPLDNVGIGVHANLRELVGYGWTPYNALKAAITAPAKYLGVSDEVGTLEVGKIADLIAVNGNPLEDINAVMDIEMTMAGGAHYTPEELMAPFTTVSSAQGDAGPETELTAPATRISERASDSVGDKYWWHDPEVVAEEYDHACDAYAAINHRAEISEKSGAGSTNPHGKH